MAVQVSTTNYWLHPQAVTLQLNALGNPDYIQVSVLAGSVIMAYRQDVIGYDATGNFRQWLLQAYNSVLDSPTRKYVYARLSQTDNTALIVYTDIEYDALGAPLDSTSTADTITGYYFIPLATISASTDGAARTWETVFATGTLNTDRHFMEESESEWTKMFRLNQVSDLIEVLKTISSAKVNSLEALFFKLGTNVVTDIATSTSSASPSDSVLVTSGWVDKALSALDDKYLSKISPDTAAGLITFLQGLIANGKIQANAGIDIGQFAEGLLGKGVRITAAGEIEAQSLRLWKFLEVPELRYNQVRIYTGIDWNTFGGGIVKSVEIDTDGNGDNLQSGIITLKLEEGQIGCIDLDDMAMGIFHNFGGSNDTEDEDTRDGNLRFKGFNTCYFRVTEILESDCSRFRYVLRGVSDTWTQQHHPSEQMNFACYANPTNTSRQHCKYSTTKYEVRLENMTTWEYGQANIYEIGGVLDGFQLNGKTFTGNGRVIGKGYFYGNIEQFSNAPVLLRIDTDGYNDLAPGETMHVTCTLSQGFIDVTDTVTSWKVTRETNDAASDAVWNLYDKVQAFDGEIDITYADLGGNELTNDATLFSFVAIGSTGQQLATNQLVI